MSSITTKSCCATCEKEITILKCESCWQIDGSRQSVAQDQANVNQGALIEQRGEAQQQYALIQEVDEWECNAINQILQTAKEARRLVLEHKADRICHIETKLTTLAEQLQKCHREKNFISQNTPQQQNELPHLTEELMIPATVMASETKVVVEVAEEPETIHDEVLPIPNIHADAKWIQKGITVAGGNRRGNGLNQLSNPRDISVADDQTIYVTDCSNHRVVEWKKGATSGQVVAGGNGQGDQANQLNCPTALIVDKERDSLIICDFANNRVVRWPRQNGTSGTTILSDIVSFAVTMDSDGCRYVSEYDKHQVTRWKMGETNGTVVAGGNEQGNRLDQLNNPMHLFVDEDHSLYVSDGGNHRVVKWVKDARDGVVVAGGQGEGSGLAQLSFPRGVIVDQLGALYVADYSNHRVMRWTKGATEGSVVVGGNAKGAEPNQFNGCWDLSFDGQGSLFVCDSSNRRVQKFNIDTNSV